MPGKPDSHEPQFSNTLGTYCPGSKEYRAYDEGYQRRYFEGGSSKSNTIHAAGTAEYAADQAGWTAAHENADVAIQRMPWATGNPGA